MLPIKMIVAYSINRVIGNNGSLPWHIPGDLKRFKELTENNIVIMGRVTYDSLPKKPLPNRINIVLTTDLHFDPKDPDVIVFHYLSDLSRYLEINKDSGKIAYVIGGQSIYTQLLSIVDKVYATEINSEIEGDTFFPSLTDRIWKETNRTSNESEDGLQYDYVTYERF